MILKIVVLVYLCLLLLTAYYLWQKRKDHFLIFNNQTNTNFQTIMTCTAILLFLESLLGFVLLLLFTNKYYNLITIFLSCFTILIFSLLINQKNE